MRIYSDCRELVSEMFRDVWEMGQLCQTNSMQNLVVKDDENLNTTKEIINYSYCLTKLSKPEYLFLNDPEVNKNWVHAEFKERISGFNVNPGEAYKIRLDVWDKFLVSKRDDYHGTRLEFDYTYNQRINPGIYLNKIINELVSNPGSRQCILSIWDREDILYIGGNKRVPCSIYYQFLIRDNKLHIIYNQRSADAMTHIGNDIWLAWALKDYVTDQVNKRVIGKYDAGYLYHNIASLHCYRKDWDKLKTTIDIM